MKHKSETHGSADFGRAENRVAQLAPEPHPYGGPSAVTLDGLVERESGRTPGPPAVSMRTLLIILVVMFVLGVLGLLVGLRTGFLGPQIDSGRSNTRIEQTAQPLD